MDELWGYSQIAHNDSEAYKQGSVNDDDDWVQETQLSLTGRAQHRIIILPGEYDSRKNAHIRDFWPL